MPRLIDVIFRGQNAQLIRSMEEIDAQGAAMGRTMKAAGAASSAAAVSGAERWKQHGDALQTFGRSAMAVAAPMIAVGAVSGKMAMDFQQSMELIHTQAGMSQRAVNSLSQSVLNLAGRGVSQSPKELAEGLFHVASLGVPAKQAMAVLKVAATGADVGLASLTDTTTALASAVAGGVRGAGNFSHAMAIMNAAVGAGDMHMQDMADALGGRLLGAMKTYGVSLKDAGAALAIFGDFNVRGAAAGTLLASALRVMAAPSQSAQKSMAAIGLGSTELANKIRSRGGLLSALRDLASHLSGLSPAERGAQLAAMFGGRQAQGVMLLLSQIDRFQGKLTREQQGIAQWAKDVQKTHETAAYKLRAAWSQVEASMIKLGGTILPMAAVAFKMLANVVSGVFGWLTKLPGPVKQFVGGLALFMFVGGGTVLLLGKIVRAIGDLRKAYDVLKGSQIAARIAAKVFGTTTQDSVGVATSSMGKALGPANELAAANERLAASYDAVAGSADAAAASVDAAAAAEGGAGAAGAGAAGGAEAGAVGAAATGGEAGLAALTGLGAVGTLGLGAGMFGLSKLFNLGAVKPLTRRERHQSLGRLIRHGRLAAVRQARWSHPFPFQHHALGGMVDPLTEPSGNDTVPAWLTPGEGVLNQRAMAMIGGAERLSAINAGRGMQPNVTIHPVPVTLRLDNRVVAEAVIRYVTNRAARGPSSMTGGSLVLGAPGLPSTGALRLS